MKSFYSILTVPIRPAAQEQLNIGLLFVGERELYFRFSNRKLNFIKKLLPENSFNLLKSYVFGLSEQFNTSDENIIRKKFHNNEFVNYISNYNSNLVTFTKPTPIEMEVNDKNFRVLFEKFIFQFEIDGLNESITNSPSLKKQLKTILYPRIRERVNLNQIITTKEVPTLLIPSVRVNFIGQNKLPVAGQGVDFESSVTVITNGISRLISLIKAFDMENRKGQYYIVGKEPNKKHFPEQHDNWRHIRISNLIEFVDVSEVSKISNYVEKHDVRPFVED